MEGRWKAPKEKCQVAFHWETQRFGLVTRSMDRRDAKVQIFFPDKMQYETRYSRAFVESGHVVPPGVEVNGFRAGYQGLCWLDNKGVLWYLMADGLSCGTEPEMLPVVAHNDNKVRTGKGKTGNPRSG